MKAFFDNPYVLTVTYYLVTVICLIVALAIFAFFTKYNDWEQIKQGNLSVALATGGKILGICNVFRFSIQHNDTLLQAVMWGGIGFLLLLLAYYMFELIVRNFKVEDEIAQDNRAVGFLSLSISLGLSYIIGSSII